MIEKITTIKAPITVGDTIYFVDRDARSKGVGRYYICKLTVDDVTVKHGFTHTEAEDFFDYEDIGKTFFLTLEEAVEHIRNKSDYHGYVLEDGDNEEYVTDD